MQLHTSRALKARRGLFWVSVAVIFLGPQMVHRQIMHWAGDCIWLVVKVDGEDVRRAMQKLINKVHKSTFRAV